MKPTLKILSSNPHRMMFTKSFSENHSVTMILFILTALLLAPLAALHAAEPILIADFESETYGEWKVEGDAFGKGPA